MKDSELIEPVTVRKMKHPVRAIVMRDFTHVNVLNHSFIL